MKEEQMLKRELLDRIEQQKDRLFALSDQICDHPELGLQEYQASGWLEQYLREAGYFVESGVGGFETAFRAEYRIGNGSGPKIGLLCEYDALEGVGHGCGHHMQGPSIVGAAKALAETLTADTPCVLVVYGTPAEETLGAKIPMYKNGCFRELDLALMTHASGSGTSVDNRTLAMSQYDVTFHGKKAHAAISPDAGRSAMDAMLLSFSGLEFLREHIPDDIRIHYCIPEAIRPVNIVHDRAVASYALRGYDRNILNRVIDRFKKVVKGASIMTETTYDMELKNAFDNGIAVDVLKDGLMETAAQLGAPNIQPSRKKTGSTDFGTLSHYVPGACIRVDCDCRGVAGHSQELAALGKSAGFHNGILYAARILAVFVCSYVHHPELQKQIREEFAAKSENSHSE